MTYWSSSIVLTPGFRRLIPPLGSGSAFWACGYNSLSAFAVVVMSDGGMIFPEIAVGGVGFDVGLIVKIGARADPVLLRRLSRGLRFPARNAPVGTRPVVMAPGSRR